MRGAAFPSRGSGVIVFVTNPSSARATSGAVSASRQPEALSSGTQHRPFDAEALQLAVDLHRTAIAGAVAAGHGRLPRELRARTAVADRVEHRLRTAREHVVAVRDQLGDERRIDRNLCSRKQRRRPLRDARSESRARPAGSAGSPRDTAAAPSRCRRRRAADARRRGGSRSRADRGRRSTRPARARRARQFPGRSDRSGTQARRAARGRARARAAAAGPAPRA